MLCKLAITPHCKKFNYSKVGRSLIWLATWKKQFKCLVKKKKNQIDRNYNRPSNKKVRGLDTFPKSHTNKNKTKYTNIHEKVKQCKLIMHTTP